MEEKYTILVLQKTGRIIETLLKYPNGLTLAELSEEAAINKATTFRILLNLQEGSYIVKNTSDGRYCLGYRFVEISSAVLSRFDIRQLARPYLEQLSVNVREVVHLVVLDGTEGLYIDKVENFTSPFKMYSQVGGRMMLHCTAAGKVLLSGMSGDEVENVVRLKGLPQKTKNTITQSGELRQELERIRNRGYGVDEIENEEGIRCIAAPIYNYQKHIIAAVSVAGTTLSVTRDRIPELAAELKEITAKISREIGGENTSSGKK